MAFNKTEYQEARASIICRIKANLTGDSDEGFIADGVICPDKYEQEPVKILCILAEPYGYEGEGFVDIEGQPDDPNLMGLTMPRVQTPRRLSTMLYLLTNSLERRSKITLEEWKKVPRLLQVREEHTRTLQSVLEKIAWINVKKACNPIARMNPSLVKEHAHRNREILRDQIASISPDVIIMCGSIVCSVLLELQLIPTSCKEGVPWEIQNCDGRKFIEVSHPASKDWMSYEKIYDIYETIFDQMA